MKRIAVLIGFLVIGLVSAVAPPGRETEAQANCFQETQFCITTPEFAEYFRVRGGYRTLGYPVSRTFQLEGFPVQVFQRVVLQLQGKDVTLAEAIARIESFSAEAERLVKIARSSATAANAEG